MHQQHFDGVPVLTSILTRAPSTTTWSASFGISRPSAPQVPVPLATSFSTTTTSSMVSLSHPGAVGFPLSLDSQNKNQTEHLVHLFRQFLQQVSGGQSMASPSQTPFVKPLGHPGIPTVADLRQNPLLASQADNILAAMPLFSSAMAGKLGKSAGDLTISAPVKNAQLWPHQFVVKLDSTIIAYKELTLPQFVFGFLECLHQAPPSQQPPMLSHLSHLMDLASRFQWAAVRAYHARVLKAIEQGSSTWGVWFHAIPDRLIASFFGAGTAQQYCSVQVLFSSQMSQ